MNEKQNLGGVAKELTPHQEITVNSVLLMLVDVWRPSHIDFTKSNPIFNVVCTREDKPGTPKENQRLGKIVPLYYERKIAADYKLSFFIEQGLIEEEMREETVEGKLKHVSYIKWIGKFPTIEKAFELWKIVTDRKNEWIANHPKPKKSELEQILQEQPTEEQIDKVIDDIINDYSSLTKKELMIEILKGIKSTNDLLQKLLSVDTEAKQLFENR